jgi:hypothetical protein
VSRYKILREQEPIALPRMNIQVEKRKTNVFSASEGNTLKYLCNNGMLKHGLESEEKGIKHYTDYKHLEYRDYSKSLKRVKSIIIVDNEHRNTFIFI